MTLRTQNKRYRDVITTALLNCFEELKEKMPLLFTVLLIDPQDTAFEVTMVF